MEQDASRVHKMRGRTGKAAARGNLGECMLHLVGAIGKGRKRAEAKDRIRLNNELDPLKTYYSEPP